MITLRSILTGGLAVLATGVFAQGGPDNGSMELLEKIIQAAGRLRYSGTRTVELKFGPDQVKHIEYVLKDGNRTRIEFPPEGSYRGQIIVETEIDRRHYFPDRNQLEILPPHRDELIGRLVKFLRKKGRGPRVAVLDGPTIAGIDTKLVEISGGPNNGPIQRLWFDPVSYVVVKREVYDKTGKTVAASEYTKIDLRPRFHGSDFRLEVPSAKIVTPRDKLLETASKGGFRNVSLPPKDPFKLESCRIQRIGDVSAFVQVYVNANGRLTLFQLRTSVDPRQLQRFGRGEVNAHSWQSGGSTFVLLGDLPEDKLRDIAQRLTS